MDDDIKAQLEAAYAHAIDTTGLPRCERCQGFDDRRIKGIARIQCTCGTLCNFCAWVDVRDHCSQPHGMMKTPEEVFKLYKPLIG